MISNKRGISFLGVALLVAAIVSSVTFILIKRKHFKAGTVVILNGTSSSGKTSVMGELKKIYGNSYEIVIGDEWVKSYQPRKPLQESMS